MWFNCSIVAKVRSRPPAGLDTGDLIVGSTSVHWTRTAAACRSMRALLRGHAANAQVQISAGRHLRAACPAHSDVLPCALSEVIQTTDLPNRDKA